MLVQEEEMDRWEVLVRVGTDDEEFAEEFEKRVDAETMETAHALARSEVQAERPSALLEVVSVRLVYRATTTRNPA